MRREIEVQEEINHPNVMKILDSSDYYFWYTMPIAVRTVENLNPPLDDLEVFSIISSVTNGLKHAHQFEYIHRDIKPSNILQLIDQSEIWVVSDWGLVRRNGNTTTLRTEKGVHFGTQGFAAPELWNDAHIVDERADVYSLGRLAAWCATGKTLLQNVPLFPDGTWRSFVQATTPLNIDERVRDMDHVSDLLDRIKKEIFKEESTNGFQPIKMEGIVQEDVSRPRNDGTRGSALYSIPIKLSQSPSDFWRSCFIETWNHPPRYTTMHRPRIANVVGDRIILNGTTIEELKNYHLETLKLCVDKANEETALKIIADEKLAGEEREQIRKHRESISKISQQLDFD